MSTSRLQKYVKSELEKYNRYFFENYKPEWLIDEQGARLELDFFLERQNIAIEIQGEQHFIFVPFFHNDVDTFNRQLQRDKLKREICQARGIYLIEIATIEQVRPAMLQILDIEHKPEALKKILKRNKLIKSINNLPPVEKCIWHAIEIEKYQKQVIELSRKKKIKEPTKKIIRSLTIHIKQHKRNLVKLAKEEDTAQIAIYLLKQLFKPSEIPEVTKWLII